VRAEEEKNGVLTMKKVEKKWGKWRRTVKRT
jgi:hypothetical protein